MISTIRGSLRESAASLRSVFAETDLRRLQLGHATSLLSLWSFGVASSVYAFEIGGAALVGALMLLRMAPAAVASPFAAVLADRYPRQRVLVATDVIRAGLTAAAAACVALDLAPASVFVLTALLIVVSTAFEPAKNALLPSLVRNPEQLTAANAVGNTFQSASIFGGPALGGAVLALASIQAAMAVSAGLLVLSAAQLSLIGGSDDLRRDRESVGEPDSGAEISAGFRAVRDDSRLRLLVGLVTAQTFVSGMLSVLVVVVALDLLALGQGGVGLLDASVGVGGIVGGLGALSLGSRRLAPAFGVGIVLWGAPIALIGAVPETGAAIAFLAVVGVGNTLVDVAGLTLLQRVIPEDVRGRVFGVLEGLIWGSIGIGGVVEPALIAWLGIRGALVVTGLILPAIAALTWTRVARLETETAPPTGELARLRALPLFAPLAPATLETLASELTRVSFPLGKEVLTQDQPADRFYIIDQGEVEVFEDGVKVRTQGPGEFFGEIALLRSVPRTATVRAITHVELLALDGDDFVAAVTGHAETAETAEAVIAERLGSARRRLPTL